MRTIRSMLDLSHLNPEQQEAVRHTDGPLLVVAGAGTGKTKTLTWRVAHLISTGVAPHAIIAITFTNKAAQEMRERIMALVEHLDSAPVVSTFHALGVRLLRRHASTCGLEPNFTILDRQDQVRIVRELIKKNDLDPDRYEPRKVLSTISKQRGDRVTPDTFAKKTSSTAVHIARIWKAYTAHKKEIGVVDFDDLLSLPLEMFEQNPDILALYHERWTHIHVDEYQDTNQIQYQIVKLLAQKNNHICAVGDGDQNIYSWRGADMRNLLRFEKDFPNAHVVILEKNYRSTKNILDGANAVIKKNSVRVDKKLTSTKGQGHPITIHQAPSDRREAAYIAQKIKDLQTQNHFQPKDIAILFRTHFQSRLLEEAMLRSSIPYKVLGVRFFDRKEVRDIIGYLRAARSPKNTIDLQRIINSPKRGLGATSVEHILAGNLDQLKPRARTAYEGLVTILKRIADAEEKHTPSKLIEHIIQWSGYDTYLAQDKTEGRERLANLAELVRYATSYDSIDQGLECMLENMALMADQDTYTKDDGEVVHLMTVHASKGLEFPVIFIAGMEEGLFPSTIVDENKDPEEERRLFYVAMTRAQQRLYITHSMSRFVFGRQSFAPPSHFLADIPKNTIQSDNEPSSGIKTVYLD